MPIAPLITFKAGQCEIDTDSRPYKVTPQPEPGYIYLYSEDDLTHFCWRKRDESLDSPTLDLVMIPTDASFVPYEHDTTAEPTAKTNGRIFALKFTSSSQRHLFWLQSKPQGPGGDPRHFSPRDRKIGDIVNRMLQGEEVDVNAELLSLRNLDDRRDDDGDDQMEGAEEEHGSRDRREGRSGGAGAGATGGDVRDEGEESREGGADGARAAASSNTDAESVVRNLLNSLSGQPGIGNSQGREEADVSFPLLPHLLPTSATVPMIDSATEETIETLINFLPPSVLVLASSSGPVDTKSEPTADAVAAAKASLSLDEKRSLLKRVVRSPQFHQALVSLTMALRDGGLPGIADALAIKVENGGYLQAGGMPLGGGHAVKAFIEGVKKTVQEKET